MAALSACSDNKTEQVAQKDVEPQQQKQQQKVMPEGLQTYSAEAFYETKSIFGSSINHDGTAVLVSNDESGVFNAYKYPLDGSAPTQLTASTDDAVWVTSWFPEDDRILYSSDQGGNELSHVYVRNLDGSITDLTPGDKHRAGFYGWHEDKKHFFVATNERDQKAMDLYQYSIEDFSREMVFENTDAMNLSTISDDGRWVVLQKVLSNRDNDIYLVDLNSDDNALIHVTPHEGYVSHSVYTFTPDNKKLIFGSNGEGEFQQAYSYELETGEVAPEYAADWDVSFFYYSENGKYRVAGINADSQTKLDIVNTETGAPLVLNGLPEGDLRGVSFSDDEERIVFYINSDVSPSNLYTYDIEAASAKRLSNSLNPEIQESHLVSSEVVRFESFDGVEIPNLLYKPHKASADNKVPGIIWIHGGPGGQTRKGYNAVIQHLVNHGYAVLGINNRGSSGYGKTFFHLDDKRHGEDDLQDVVYGKKYLQSLDWIDDEKIVVMGGSYGGYLTMAAMAFTDEFQLGINIFGVTNWVRTLESIPPWWESFRDALYDELGDPAVDKERLTRISPVFHGDKVQKPVLVVQGANDPRVLQVESDEMVAAIRANGVPVEYVLFDDEGHGFSKKANRITAQNAYLDFLKKHL
ncbi:S9 family peptidase [Alteromonas sediminis]|uniref:S9 family peptidase n=2 Tax=Alteromonas sediminis TaxID=2259342 RepID=A0A3N5ZEH8_9ALTE|nr:S9 family peptidase [Alteromonas sediminis]